MPRLALAAGFTPNPYCGDPAKIISEVQVVTGVCHRPASPLAPLRGCGRWRLTDTLLSRCPMGLQRQRTLQIFGQALWTRTTLLLLPRQAARYLTLCLKNLVGRVGVDPTSPAYEAVALADELTAPEDWSERQDSNLRFPCPEHGGLPLPYAPVNFGAAERSRTSTGFPIRPSNGRVCHFATAANIGAL